MIYLYEMNIDVNLYDILRHDLRVTRGEQIFHPESKTYTRVDTLYFRPGFYKLLAPGRNNFVCKAWVTEGNEEKARADAPFIVNKTQ